MKTQIVMFKKTSRDESNTSYLYTIIWYQLINAHSEGSEL